MATPPPLKIVALAGGVGGARLADGLARLLPPEDLTTIVNIGDDFEHLGLYICPDLDTVCYTLAGLANPATGWGRAGESWSALETLAALGGPDWFRLGDLDIGMHLERTRRLRAGQPLSRISSDFCRSWGIHCTVLPASDQPVPTIVLSDEGELPFQEYFVHRQCRPVVSGFRFDGVAQAGPAPGVLEALEAAELVIVCPSNPWVSIDPILAIPGVRQAVQARPTLAVSPIIGGKAVKGPAAKMFAELGLQPSALAVARHYGARSAGGLLDGFVLDQVDLEQAAEVEKLNVRSKTTNTIMKNSQDRLQLAVEMVQFAKRIRPGASQSIP
jgi:LPPG:FO 2-phospho-L-lactate transferase